MIDFKYFSWPKFKSQDLSTEQTKIIEDFPFDEMVKESKDQPDLVKRINKNIDDASVVNKIIEVYNKVGLLDDEYVPNGFPLTAANDLVSVQPMTAPSSEVFHLKYRYEDNAEEKDLPLL